MPPNSLKRQVLSYYATLERPTAKPKTRLHEQFLSGNFCMTSFICSCTWGHLLGFYVANTFAEKLVCQFLCGKQKLSITSICSCIWLVTYLSHVFICTFAKLCAIIISLLKPIFRVESKNICCIIYTSNRICHGRLSNKNYSCKRAFYAYRSTVTSVSNSILIDSAHAWKERRLSGGLHCAMSKKASRQSLRK